MLRFFFPSHAGGGTGTGTGTGTTASTVSTILVGFYDVLHLVGRIRSGDALAILLNTLPSNQQSFLVSGTIACEKEEAYMNEIIGGPVPLSKYAVVVYGKHGTDETPHRKRRQLLNLGFVDVYVYAGGVFEWALLQEVYGADHFPSLGTPPRDFLYFASPSLLARTAPLLLTT